MRELREYGFDWGGRDGCEPYYLTASEVEAHRSHDCAIGRWLAQRSPGGISK